MPTLRLHATILLVKVHILEGETRLINLRTRMPFKYGIATMTDVPYAFLRLLVEINGSTY